MKYRYFFGNEYPGRSCVDRYALIKGTFLDSIIGIGVIWLVHIGSGMIFWLDHLKMAYLNSECPALPCLSYCPPWIAGFSHGSYWIDLFVWEPFTKFNHCEGGCIVIKQHPRISKTPSAVWKYGNLDAASRLSSSKIGWFDFKYPVDFILIIYVYKYIYIYINMCFYRNHWSKFVPAWHEETEHISKVIASVPLSFHMC